MTDNEIIQALECCLEDVANCSACPYERYCDMHEDNMLRDALDLINRQRAEIERHQAVAQEVITLVREIKSDIRDTVATARAEAIKEFAERFKTRLDISVCGYSTEEVISDIEDAIDNLVKEMTGDQI